MADQPSQPNRFQAEMPRIPGVNDERYARSSVFSKPSTKLTILVVAFLVVLGVMAWRLRSSSSLQPAPAASAPESLAVAASAAAIPSLPSPLPSAPGPIAMLAEIAQPWASKKFIFVRPDTHAAVAAMVIRLPGIAGDRSNAYWAFALTPPFGRCDLEYVTDVKDLAARYGYSTTHPMLAAPCTRSLYDPLRMGIIGNGAWTRGEVVQGPSIRPPTAIRIQLSGHSIIADRIE